MHSRHNDVCSVELGHRPDRLCGCQVELHLFLDEFSIAGVCIGVDLSLISRLDVVWPVLDRQVVLTTVSDRDDVEAVLLGAEKPMGCDSVGQLRGFATIDGHHIVDSSLSWGSKSFISSNNNSCGVCLVYHP